MVRGSTFGFPAQHPSITSGLSEVWFPILRKTWWREQTMAGCGPGTAPTS